jgi:penicillin amidase
MRRALRFFTWVIATLVLLTLVTAGWAWVQLGRSLPHLEGTRVLDGLSATVTVDRDGLGVPTIKGSFRLDVARALGFVHAQDRFFQMDLSRRRAAGELSELFGRAALATDQGARLHRFRHRAAAVLAGSSADELALVDAYVAGVNAGLKSLRAAPFEYLLLGKTPAPWTREDSVLVVASMFFTLQDSTAAVEGRAALMHDVLPPPLADFLNSTASEWDTPMQGEAIPPPVPPPADVFDLRTAPALASAGIGSQSRLDGSNRLRQGYDGPPKRSAKAEDPASEDTFADALGLNVPEDARGSNNWVVAGSRTVDGRALLSDDMHLGLSVPNIWYRASLVWTIDRGPRQVTGVTLPGTPAMVVGSNGRIAWGFTNTTADWSDRVLIELVPGDPTRYLTPDGPRAFEVTRERISVDDEDDQWIDVRETIWGPVPEPDHAGRLYAIAWVAHRPDGLNLRFAKLETAETLEQAMDIANGSGTPAQNCVFADDRGQIAWTIAGNIPRRVGFTGQLPVSWADGTRGWQGWHDKADYPRIVNPPDGVIVTANNRLVSGRYLEMLGDGGYDPGARARQILNGVRKSTPVSAKDMLEVQLDDRALLMERWRNLALDAIGDDASGGRAEFRQLLRDGWTGRASVDSVAYRLVRQFRTKTAELAFAPFVARLRTKDRSYPSTPGRSVEGPVWALVTSQPPHLLNPVYANWKALLLDAIDQTIASLTENKRVLSDRTWGEANTLLIRHPLSRALPMLSRWIDMPSTPSPGDNHMPRVQTPTNGASERLTVSPGHEAEGYFHMATGQSGHPRSPHYADGHSAWVEGKATPFLPGPKVATLELRPK